MATIEAKPRSEPAAEGCWPTARKHVTVLFADLCGSTAHVGGCDPEEARELLRPVVAAMVDAVEAFGGTVIHTPGDGVLGLFGAPASFEDHADRACLAASRVHEAMDVVAGRLERAPGSIRARVGLHSGTVVISPGTWRAQERDVHGAAVHLAARVEELASPGETWVTQATARLLGEAWELGPEVSRPLRGFDRPVEMRAIRAAPRGGGSARGARRLEPLLGRFAELRLLQATFRECRERSQGRVIVMAGEAGVGKTRLARELVAQLDGWRVIWSQCDKVLDGVGCRAMAPVVRDALGLGLSEPLTVATIASALAMIAPELHGDAVPLAWLATPSDDITGEGSTPEQRRARAETALAAALRALATQRPVCLVMEDVQWASADTLAFVAGLCRSLTESRVVLLVTTRQEEGAPALDGLAVRLTVAPLGPADAVRLVRERLGRDPSVAPLGEAVLRQCGGNPFYIEQVIQELADRGDLHGSGGTYWLSAPAGQLPLPVTVELVLASRIDRLDVLTRQALWCLAVAGFDASERLLRAVGEFGTAELEAALARLTRSGLASARTRNGAPLYRCQHALIQQVAYGGLVKEQRVRLHAQIARALLADEEAAPHDRTATIAVHAFGGELWALAADWLHRAGRQALARSAHRVALALVGDALEAVRRLEATEETVGRQVDMLCDCRTALWALDDHGRIVSILKEAAALAEQVRDRGRMGRIASFLVQEYRLAGRHGEAVAMSREAMALGEAVGDLALVYDTRFRLALTLLNLGRLTEARDLLALNLAMPASGSNSPRQGTPGWGPTLADTWLAICLCELGEVEAALEAAERGFQAAELHDPGYSLISAQMALGCVRRHRGELTAAERILKPAFERCAAAGIVALRDPLAYELGSVYLAQGRAAAAVPLLGEAAAVAGARPSPRSALYSARLASALARSGRRAEGEAMARRAIELAEARGELGHLAWAHLALADCLDGAAAVAAGEQARALAARLGLRAVLRISDGTRGGER